MKNLYRVLICIVLCFTTSNTLGEEIQIDASLDGGYFDLAPDNNLGGHTHVPVGVANNGRINRSVFFMDIASLIPAGTRINSASFEFDVTQQGGPQGSVGVNFALHRVLTAWDEGTGTTNIGEVTSNGATWSNATGATTWTTPGGDFDAAVSGLTFVDHNLKGSATYSLGNVQLVADIQAIVDGTADNFGFLMKSETENTLGSAMRVTSREGGDAARLVVDFTILGDLNGDTVVNLLDVPPFIALLSSGGFQEEGDFNGDGAVNPLDVSLFIALLSGGS